MNLYTPEDKRGKCFSCSSLKGFTSWQSIFRPFFIGTEPLWMPLSLPHPADALDGELKASVQNPGACWLYQNTAASILEGL